MSKIKTEIISVIKSTNHVQNAQGDGKSKAVYEVKYRVRFHNAMSMDAEEIVLAEDELDAYSIAKQIIKEKQSHGEF
jgi:uncharacterized protein YktA (UPF0223 family)